MATFNYKATNKKGRLVKDTITASSEDEAKSLLADKNLDVLVLNEEKREKNLVFLGSFGNKFSTTEKIIICRYLSVTINSGLSLGDAFDLIVEGSSNPTVKKVLTDISYSLRKGHSLYDGFSKYPQHFDSVFLSMIKAGETSGTVGESFDSLSKQLKQEDSLRKKVFSSLLYPIIIVVLMFAVGLIMFTFVLPRVGKVFLNLKMEIPLTTKLLLQTSLFVEKRIWLLFVGLLTVFTTLFFFAKSGRGKKFFSSLVLKLPIIKKIYLYYSLVRFNQNLSYLLKSGVPIGESLEISSRTLSFFKNAGLIKSFNEKISQGVSLSNVLAETKLFPQLMTSMIAVGEKTGTLDKTLIEISSFYQDEVEDSLKNFMTVLEPVLMIFVGIAVGFMILTFISPIYSLIGKLQPG